MKLTARELYWAIVVGALAVGWWQDSKRWERRVMDLYGEMNRKQLTKISAE